jgi:HSP20 family protein
MAMRALLPEGGMTTFRKEMDRFLDQFWSGDTMERIGAWTPDIDVTETKDTLTIKAEVPGIEPKDLQLTLEGGILTLRGEKRQETEQKDEHFFRSERHYGSFVRSIRLPVNVDSSKVSAAFKHGVLTVVMPKTAEAKGKAIPIATN